MGNYKKILCMLLAALLLSGCTGTQTPAATTVTAATTAAPTVPPTTAAPTTPPTTPGPTVPPTTAVQPERFLLSFAGDCTLAGNHGNEDNYGTYTKVVGKNYDYPMSNVKHIFEADDLSLVNLECALTESDPTEEEMVELETHRFRFRGPPDYANILSRSSIEFASCANNHSLDYGKQGLSDTKQALKDANVAFASFGSPTVVTTESGLKVGIFAISFLVNQSQLENIVKQLRRQEVEVIIMSIHWGEEKVYLPSQAQQNMAHWAIDAGVNIVYGHHSHTLMPIEAYNGGIIYYSLGNFSFGGNFNPADKDTAIIQQEILRYPDGTVILGDTTAIPCRVSTLENWNDYRPTPYEPEHEGYQRAFDKLSGNFYDAEP